VSGNADVEGTHKIDFAVEIWGKSTPVLLAGGFQPESARKAIEEKYKDYQVLVVFGRYFISNPDLVFRVKKGLALSRYNRETFYVPESRVGYVDYPFSREFEEEVLERGAGKGA
jgi:NADPH2 dehydrogenase